MSYVQTSKQTFARRKVNRKCNNAWIKNPQDFTHKQYNCSIFLPLIYNNSKKFLSSNNPSFLAVSNS